MKKIVKFSSFVFDVEALKVAFWEKTQSSKEVIDIHDFVSNYVRLLATKLSCEAILLEENG